MINSIKLDENYLYQVFAITNHTIEYATELLALV